MKKILAGLSAALLLAVLAAFIVPAAAALLPAFGSMQPPAGGRFDGGLFAGGRILGALRFTLTEALLSSIVAVLIGLPAAFFVARRSFPGRRLLLSLSGVPLCIPPMIIALAFVLFYGRQGYLNTFLMSVFNLEEPPVTFLYSLAGVVIAHGFYNFPVVLRTVAQAWERLPQEEEEAALLLGADRFRVLRTITLPRLSGPILASAVLVFLYCFFSFVIVLLFGGVGGTTLEVELYQAARSSLDFRQAGLIALVETAAALGIVFLYVYLQKLLSAGTEGLKKDRPRTDLKGRVEHTILFIYILFLAIFFIGPLLSILVRSFVSAGGGLYTDGFRFSPDAWLTLFGRRNFLPALGNTVVVGLAVAAISTLAALFYALARLQSNGGRGGRPVPLLFRMIPLSPLAVSSVMLGFGWTLLVPRGNLAVLVLAQSAMAWPFAWTQIQSSLDRIPRSLHDAANLLSPRRLEAPFRILIPLASRGILSGAGFVFAISAGDATLPLVLSLSGFENLPLMLFRLTGSYRFSEACACAVILAVLCGFVFFLQDGTNDQ